MNEADADDMQDFSSEVEDFSELSEDDIEGGYRLRGQKLGVLLAASNFPDDVKEAILNILPDLSLDQADEFLEMLESKYLDEATGDIDELYRYIAEEANKENAGTTA